MAQAKKKDKGGVSAYDVVRLLVPFVVTAVVYVAHMALPNVYPEDYSESVFPMVLICAMVLWAVLDLFSIPFKKVRAVMIKDSWLFAVLVLFFALWDWGTIKTGILTLPLMPSPDAMFNVLINENANMLVYLGQSALLLFLGLFVGLITGLLSGLLMGWFKAVDYWLSPIVWIFGPMPGAVMLPIVACLMPSNYTTAIAIVALAMWFALAYNLGEAVKGVDVRVIEAARVSGASNVRILFHVILPLCMPNIFSGVFMGTCFSFTSLLSAEMLSMSGGLGSYMVWSKANIAYADIYAATIVVVIFFFIVLEIVNRIQAYVLRWKANPVEW